MNTTSSAGPEKLRIALLSESFPPKESGVSTSVCNLAEGLRDLGHTVRIITYLDGLGRPDTEEVVGTTIPWKYEMALHKVLRVLDMVRGRKNPDPTARYARARFGGICGLLTRRYVEAFNPQIIAVPDHNAPTALVKLPQGAKVAFVCHHNSARFANNPDVSDTTLAEMAPVIALEQKALSRADAAICVSEYMKRVFYETYRFDGQVTVLPNMVSKSIFDYKPSDLRNQLKLADGVPLIYIPSAYAKLKGGAWLQQIITAIANGWEGQVAFYCSGNYPPFGNRLGSNVPPNALVYDPGSVPYAQNIPNAKACDFCISPVVLENFSMALLEAQFCGLPVVTFDVGGNKEIVMNGETGYIVPYRDIDGIVSKALELVRDVPLRKKMSAQASDRAMATFGPKVVASKYEAFFRTLLTDGQAAKEGG